MSHPVGLCECANIMWSAMGSALGCQKSWVENESKNISMFGVLFSGEAGEH